MHSDDQRASGVPHGRQRRGASPDGAGRLCSALADGCRRRDLRTTLIGVMIGAMIAWLPTAAVADATESPATDDAPVSAQRAVSSEDQVSAQGAVSAENGPWWAFRPFVKPLVPETQHDDWSQTPVDRFVFRRLTEYGLRPAPRATRPALVRRLYFDLVGMPPTPEEIDSFVSDDAADAWERLVDRLLDDPRYGEHWARFWLDLVRYADSDGWNKDAYRPHIWRYRDYIIRAFNEDRPYPKFVQDQLAGDETAADDPDGFVAAGFLRLGIYEYNQRDARGQWDAILNEMTDVTADVFLGIGLACARCHDHKFDPLLQADYYRLRAFFEPIVWRDDIPAPDRGQSEAAEQNLAAWQAASRGTRDQLEALVQPYHARKWQATVGKFPLDIQACFHKPVEQRTSWDQQMAYLVSRQFVEEGGDPLKDLSEADKVRYAVLQQELAAFDHLKPEPPGGLMTVTDFPGAVSPTLIPDASPPHPVAPGIPVVLRSDVTSNEPAIQPAVKSTGRRAALARWIARTDNPLTARVYVNRIWQQHFGTGLVATANDFGKQGQLPTHPELLNWLTAAFVENGWSTKHLHRVILTSAVWQQAASHPDAPRHQSLDPDCRLLWSARIQRLKAEQIRDSLLAVTGQLLPESGGPGVEASVPRRAIYVRTLRNTPDPFLQAFDAATGLQSVCERSVTTTPTQSLLLLNEPSLVRLADRMATSLEQTGGANRTERLRKAMRLTWGRGPTAEELAVSLEFFAACDSEAPQAADHDRLADFCHVLFNSGEFLYVD